LTAIFIPDAIPLTWILRRSLKRLLSIKKENTNRAADPLRHPGLRARQCFAQARQSLESGSGEWPHKQNVKIKQLERNSSVPVTASVVFYYKLNMLLSSDFRFPIMWKNGFAMNPFIILS
jgi:hypothetical protein